MLLASDFSLWTVPDAATTRLMQLFYEKNLKVPPRLDVIGGLGKLTTVAFNSTRVADHVRHFR